MDWKSYVYTTRKRYGLSQSQFAAILKVTPFSVQAWEQGRAIPHAIHQDIIHELGRRADEFEIQALEKAALENRRKDTALRDFILGATVTGVGAIGLYYLLKLLFESKNQSQPQNKKTD